MKIMKTILTLFAACALVLFTADITRPKAEAGILDVFKSVGTKNNEWFAANRQNITGQFTNLGHITVTNYNGQSEQLEALSGWVENKSDQQISAVVFDIIVSQPGTGLEALRERVWLGETVFKTEKANFTIAHEAISASQIMECLNRNTNYQWSGEIVTAIPQSLADDPFTLQKYYKVNSIWCRTK